MLPWHRQPSATRPRWSSSPQARSSTCPSFRHHPAIVAQAAATLEAIYPGRSWLGLGSGEALNEQVFGGYWPEPVERIAMMFEAIELIQKLFSGKDVKHAGDYFKMHTTRLWTLTDPP